MRLDELGQDLRHAVRGLWRSRGFTLTAVMTLAIGIGVNAAVFTVTNATLFKGHRLVDRNDRIVYLDTAENGRGCCASYPDVEDWRARASSFQGIGAVADLRFTFDDGGGLPERYDATQITANGFALLGVQPIIGRDFTPADEQPGAAPVAILTHRLWEQRFGSDAAIVGRTFRMNGAPTTVIGVMPRGFGFPQNQDLWTPLVPTPDVRRRQARGLWYAFGRLQDDATIETARAEMDAIGRRLAAAYPDSNRNTSVRVRPFHELYIGPNAVAIYGSMWGAVCFVLLIACANLANLTLARAIGRARELSLRMVLGAGRWRIVRQLLVESAVLSAIGGLAGWWLAVWGVQAYARVANPPGWDYFQNLLDYTMDWQVVAYLAATSIGAMLVFGLVPALRLSTLDANAVLKDGGRGGTSGSRRRLSSALVVAEVALTIVLLAGAGVMMRSFVNVYSAPIGMDPSNITASLVILPRDRYPDVQTQTAFYDRLLPRLAATPGIESVTLASNMPVGGTGLTPYESAGAPVVEERLRPQAVVVFIDPAYFQTMGVALHRGRAFTETDGAIGPPVAIVNERFASIEWPGDDPIGKRVRSLRNAGEPWLTVVGVAPNIMQSDQTRQTFGPVLYVPQRGRAAATMWLFARTAMPIGSVSTSFRREVQAVDPALSIWLGPMPLAERLAGAYWSNGVYGALFLAFAAVALLLASVGLYAVVAHGVSQRTQEIGIRMAIGAARRDVVALVARQGLVPLALGLGIGLVASFGVNRLLASALVQVSPADPLALGIATITLVVATLLGCLWPVRRATCVDPVIALRHE